MGEKGLGPAWIDSRTAGEKLKAPRQQRPTWRFWFGGFLVWAILFYYSLTRDTGTPLKKTKKRPDNPMDPWSSITPSRNLTWHPCYTTLNPTFLCARLTLPMDYARPLPPTPFDPAVPEVHIALLLLPAQTPPPRGTKPKSPLFINPGGPGGSGVTLALLGAGGMQDVLGSDQPILGFDPRGVMFTTPLSDCWAKPRAKDCRPDDPRGECDGDGGGDGDDDGDAVVKGLMHRLQWQQVSRAYGLVSEGGKAMRDWEVAQRGVSGLCGERDGRLGGESGLGWAGTEMVVRDMVEMVDKWDEWREREGLEESEWKGKLVYWGFSYGSYLGAAFARTFPDRVGRVVLDGVVDAELYEEPMWAESLVDTDKVLGEFFRYCAEAGKKCLLYRDGDGKEDVQRRYEEAMEDLRTNPIIFTHPRYFYPAIFRHDLVKQLVFTALYSPIQGFPMVAWLVNYIHQRDTSLLSGMFQDEQLLCSLSADPMLMHMLSDAQRSIMCGDKLQPVNYTLAEWESSYKSLASTSQFADFWTPLMMQCSGWDLSAPNQTPRSSWKSIKSIYTTNPLLFLSNTYDPVTPLRAAVKMALKFRGAGLLEQKALGHCTISAVSTCTANVIKEYLTLGKLPPPPKDVDDQYRGDWKRCDADQHPWGPSPREVLSTMSAEERKMAEGWQKVREALEKVQKRGVDDGQGLDTEAIMAMANFGNN